LGTDILSQLPDRRVEISLDRRWQISQSVGYTCPSEITSDHRLYGQIEMNKSQRDRRLAVSLEGDDLKRWESYVDELREREGLLNAALKINQLALAIALPGSYVFKLAGMPFRLMGTLTFGAIHVFFRLFLIPFFAVVLSTSTFWDAAPRTRPALILVTPIFVIVTLWLIALFPENPDIRNAKTDLCKLWPLSRSRLEWIRTHRIY